MDFKPHSKKVLFLDTVHPILWERLSNAGYHCMEAYAMSREELLLQGSLVNGLVLRSRLKIDREILERLSHLEWIARSGSGLEGIDLDFAKERGIYCINSPEGNADAVGEHALGMLLMLFNKLHLAHAEVCQGLWRREANRGLELAGKNIGLIGYGVMGQSFAKKLSGLSCRILAYDKYLSGFGNAFVEEVSLQKLCEETDILSLHLPLNDETRALVNAEFISAFRQNIYLINTSRGPIVPTQVVVEGLKKGKILGACLDVLEHEPHHFESMDANLPEIYQELFKHEKVVLSPHIAGWTRESYFKLSNVLANKILSLKLN